MPCKVTCTCKIPGGTWGSPITRPLPCIPPVQNPSGAHLHTLHHGLLQPCTSYPRASGSPEQVWPKHPGLVPALCLGPMPVLLCFLLWGFLTVRDACGDLGPHPRVVERPGVNICEAAPDQWEPGDWQRELPILTGEQTATRCIEFSAEEGPPGGSPHHGSVWPACTHVPAAVPVSQPYCRWPSSWRARFCFSLCFWGTLGHWDPTLTSVLFYCGSSHAGTMGERIQSALLSPLPSGNTARGQPGVNDSPTPPPTGFAPDEPRAHLRFTLKPSIHTPQDSVSPLTEPNDDITARSADSFLMP